MQAVIFIMLILFGSIQTFSQTNELFFLPDSGKRVDGGAMGGGVYMDENGRAYLYSTDGANQNLFISEDGLNFTKVNINDYPDYRSLLMPDGTFIRFDVVFENDIAHLKVNRSTDGFHFQRDSVSVFTFPETYFAVPNVYHTQFFNSLGGICFIYLGGEEDNARSIYSPPGDEINFGNYQSNIFSDSTLGRSFTYVDPKGMMLPDGRLRVITMNQHGPPAPPAARKGTIYTFTSADNGHTWTQDPDYRLRYDSFTEFDVYSLNDPKLVRLPDGRYRIYVAAMIKESNGEYKYSILSATSSDGPNGIGTSGGNEIEGFRLYNNYPNPFSKSSGGNSETIIYYRLAKQSETKLEIYNLLGQKVRTLVNDVQSAGFYNARWNGKNEYGEEVPSGIYIYNLTTPYFRSSKKMAYMK